MTSTNYTITSNSVKGKIAGITGAVLTLVVPYIIWKYTENEYSLVHGQSFCPFKMLTGFPCPGCGITKSIIFFYQGDIGRSIGYHWFGALTVILCLLTIVLLLIELITKKEYLNQFIFNKRIALYLGTTLAVYHFIRIIFFIKENNIDSILKQSIWK